MSSIQIKINNQTELVSRDTSLEQIIHHFALSADGCVFAINNQVVPKSKWCDTKLSEGDVISLFQAIAGG